MDRELTYLELYSENLIEKAKLCLIVEENGWKRERERGVREFERKKWVEKTVNSVYIYMWCRFLLK